MALIKLLIAFYFFTFFSTGEVYTYSIPKIEGGSRSLNAYAGKKIMIVTLPITQTNGGDSMLIAIDSIRAAHRDSVRVIGTVSNEDGYNAENKTALLVWYRSRLDTSILITDGIYTHKTSGTQQHPLFTWLTSSEGNEVFDIDAASPGFKYFINGRGELYAVLHPHTRLSSPLVHRLIMQ